MTRLNIVEADLTEAQCAELDAAAGNPDLTETILKRIAEEVMEAKAAPSAKQSALDTIHELAERLRNELMRDVLLGVHFLMHAGRVEEAQTLLCPAAAILEGEKVPGEVFQAMLMKLDQVNTERAKAGCEGCA